MTTEVDEFMSDPELTELIEMIKVSDDLLDVVDLKEGQQSSMLAWCLNPNEGHGQGDAIIKDFLIAAYGAGAECAGQSASFFNTWRPARIMASSFGCAFISREFSVVVEEPGKKRGLLDLFIVDPTNRIVVAIENKWGADLTRVQLDRYAKAVDEQIRKKPVFGNYDFAFVVLDRDLSTYEDKVVEALGKEWVLLDYQWLEVPARRARAHLERDNHAARLLMAYCHRQSDGSGPKKERASQLAARLATQHEPVVRQFRRLLSARISDWSPELFEQHGESLLYFVSQNRELCERLLLATGVASVVTEMRKILPSMDDDYLDVRRTWLALASEDLDDFTKVGIDEAIWPVYVNVQRISKESAEASSYLVRLIWNREHFADEIARDDLRVRLSKAHPSLAKLAKDNATKRRTFDYQRNLDGPGAAKAAVDLLGIVQPVAAAVRKQRA